MQNQAHNPAPVSNAGRLFKWGILLAALIPPVLLLIHITRTWANIPFFDDWETPGELLASIARGNWSFGKLVIQHNESRPLFPKLVFMALAAFGEWDVRWEMLAIFAVVCLDALLIFRLFSKLPSGRSPEAAVMVVLMNFLLFWPGSEAWTFGNTFMMVIPPVMLLCALSMNVSKASLSKKSLWNMVFAMVSTWSWSNGMLLWPLALPVPGASVSAGEITAAWNKKSAKWYAIYSGIGILNLLVYFVGYQKPGHSPRATWHLPRLLNYFFTWLGAFFGDFQYAKTLGICAFLLFAALAVAYLWLSWEEKDFTSGYPWLVMGSYTVISGIAASIGRAGLGIGQAMSSRYTMVSCYIYIAILALGWLVFRIVVKKWPAAVPQPAVFVAGLSLGVLLPWGVHFYQEGVALLNVIRDNRKSVVATWQWSKVIPDNPGVMLVLSNPARLAHYGPILEQARMIRLPRLDSTIAAHWNYTEKAIDGRYGSFDVCSLEPDGGLRLSGWTWLPERNAHADDVLFTISGTSGPPRAYTVLDSSRERPDVAQVIGNIRMLQCGFEQIIPKVKLPAGQVTISAWAVDLKENKIYPLERSFVLGVVR